MKGWWISFLRKQKVELAMQSVNIDAKFYCLESRPELGPWSLAPWKSRMNSWILLARDFKGLEPFRKAEYAYKDQCVRANIPILLKTLVAEVTFLSISKPCLKKPKYTKKFD